MELARNELEHIWQTYKQDNSEQAREKLLLHYYSLVKYVAGRVQMVVPQTWEYEDLVSYGVLGLLEAIDRFDPERGVNFETYAISRIQGRIIDETRSGQFIPRSVQLKARKLCLAQDKLEMELNRNPSDRELAAELEMTEDKFYKFLQDASYPQLLSLDFLVRDREGQGLTLREMIPGDGDVEGDLARQELVEILGEAIDSLPEKERLVLTLYYYEGLTLKEIGQVLELTSARISQIHSKAIFRLRGKLGKKKKALMGFY